MTSGVHGSIHAPRGRMLPFTADDTAQNSVATRLAQRKAQMSMRLLNSRTTCLVVALQRFSSGRTMSRLSSQLIVSFIQVTFVNGYR